MTKTKWQSAEKKLPSNLVLALGACDEDAFQNIHRRHLIANTLQISSADAERSFSLIKRIKTRTRSTMSEERFFRSPSYCYALPLDIRGRRVI